MAISSVAVAFAGCGAVPDTAPDPSPSPVPSATQAEAGLAVMGYLDNYLVRVDRDDWTPDEGMELSLRMLIGAASQDAVLLRRPLASRDLTGLIATARESVDGIDDPDQQEDIQEILDVLAFESDQLQDMALDPLLPLPTLPPRPTPTGPPPTVGSVEVESEPPLVMPTFETDCQRFFRQFPVGENERCLAVREGAVDGVAYSVYAPAPSLASFGWGETHQALIDEALAETMAVYEELGTMPDVTIVLSVNLDVASDAATIVDEDDCRIMVYTDAQRRSDAQFKQVIAQQMAHCFQAATFPEQQEAPYAARRWREDGLAAYLSSLVYPRADLELAAVEGLALVGETSSLLEWSAATAPWWQYVANEGGWSSIRAMVEAMPDGGDLNDQAVALAGHPGVDELFTGFAEAFSDGRISNASGDTIPTEWLPTVDQEVAAADAGGVLLADPFAPFSLGRRLLFVPRHLRANLEAADGDAITVRARPFSGGDWAPLPESFPADCFSDAQLVILVTSVATRSQDVGLLMELTGSGC